MISFAAKVFGFIDRLVLSRLSPDARGAAFRFARKLKARMAGGSADVDAGAPTSLGVKRSKGVMRLPESIVAEIHALRRDVDASLFENGLPGPSRYQTLYPINPEPGRILRTVSASMREEGDPTHIFLVPWIKRGGADVVLIAHVEAVIAEGGRPCVITTLSDGSPWACCLPAGVRLIEFGVLAARLSQRDALIVLANLLAGSPARTVHVINSALAWRLLGRHGGAVSNGRQVFASLFWDGAILPDGRLSGFAHEYLLAADPSVTGYISDNRTYLDVLQHRYGIAESRLHLARTPVDVKPRTIACPGDRVLWASRFAPEKLPGTLTAIAAACPDIWFDVYGEMDGASKGDHRGLLTLPNVEYHGPYDGFSSLDTSRAGVFLYTSNRDGMPNVLLEAGSAGIPIVSSLAGGIGELVDAETGWSVHSSGSVADYVAAIRQALGVDGPRRAAAMSRRIESRHGRESFGKAVREIPGYCQSGVRTAPLATVQH